MDEVAVFDTTLRDGEQAVGGRLGAREKVEIARQLARLKVDVIEASAKAYIDGMNRLAARGGAEDERQV